MISAAPQPARSAHHLGHHPGHHPDHHRGWGMPVSTGKVERRKINTDLDRQDESQPFPLSAAATADDTASAAAAPSPTSPPPQSLPSGCTQSSASPGLYTARPIYINLTSSPRPAHHSAAARPPGAVAAVTPPVPADRSHRVWSGSVSRFLLSPAAMSEESSDKTPTNPTGGDMTPGQASGSTTVLDQGEEGQDEGQEESTTAPSTSQEADTTTTTTTTATTSTTSTSSSPGPRVSLRGSAEFTGMNSVSGYYPVPRSFSDISCHHSRAGSDVSSETSRASRASAGANLEKFFNEMGMERDILDPMMRLQRSYGGGSEVDIYESVSSLESHGDARSICSALSRSEKEISDAESFERNQQQTSVVERNARIIKWLCSVKKAKTPTSSVQGSAAS